MKFILLLFLLLSSATNGSDFDPELAPNDEELFNPCNSMHCSAGRECTIDVETGEASCGCIEDCGYEPDPRRKVCTNYNETYSTECEVHQMRCYCEDGIGDKCPDHLAEKYRHVHVEYFGQCRHLTDCKADEMADFPRRMREWLFNVMKELADRRELSTHYRELQQEAEEDLSRKWSNAAVWKWCDLDGHPHDKLVSRHELFPVKAPLQTLEHCIGDFLDICDADQDHGITLQEWGKCLELEEDYMEEKCEALSNEKSFSL